VALVEEYPLTASGKVKKYELRKFAAGMAREKGAFTG
jgi:acyl-coenzyme A synthetase/AMP-(fatty) acid ligase